MKYSKTIQENLKQLDVFASRRRGSRSDVVLFPECAVTGYAFDYATLTRDDILAVRGPHGRIARRAGYLFACGFTGSFAAENCANVWSVFDRQGTVIYCYAKNQLTPSDEKWFKAGRRE